MIADVRQGNGVDVLRTLTIGGPFGVLTLPNIFKEFDILLPGAEAALLAAEREIDPVLRHQRLALSDMLTEPQKALLHDLLDLESEKQGMIHTRLACKRLRRHYQAERMQLDHLRATNEHVDIKDLQAADTARRKEVRDLQTKLATAKDRISTLEKKSRPRVALGLEAHRNLTNQIVALNAETAHLRDVRLSLLSDLRKMKRQFELALSGRHPWQTDPSSRPVASRVASGELRQLCPPPPRLAPRTFGGLPLPQVLE